MDNSKDKRVGWLLNLKVGDKVIVAKIEHDNCSRKSRTYFLSVRTIKKITPTGIIVIGNLDGTIETRVAPTGEIDSNSFQKSVIVEYNKMNQVKFLNDTKRLSNIRLIREFQDFHLMESDELNTIVSVINGFKTRKNKGDI